jgi:hypothetical protein
VTFPRVRRRYGQCMDEVKRVLERLERIGELRNAGAGSAELLGQLRGLLVDGEAWAAAEGVGTERARRALVGLDSALGRCSHDRPRQGSANQTEDPGR